MKLNKIRIDGYRNLDNASLELEKIGALVGLNNYGKSNLLEGIAMGMYFIRNQKSRPFLMSDARDIPINKHLSNRSYVFEVEFETLIKDINHIAQYSFSFSWPKRTNEGHCLESESLKIKENAPGKQFSTIIDADRRKNKANYKSSMTGRCDTKLTLMPFDMVIDKLYVMDHLYYHSLIKAIFSLRINLNNHSDPKEWFDAEHLELIDKETHLPYPENERNFPKVAFLLKKTHPEKFSMLKYAFMSLFNNIEDLEVREHILSEADLVENPSVDVPFRLSNKVYKIWVKERNNNQITDFSFLSNGTKRVFLLLTAAVMADIKDISLIAFEELENCIHPKLFQSLLMALSSVISNCRIILTSHSPFVIQYLDLSRIYLGIPNNKGTSFFKKIKGKYFKRIQKFANSENKTTGDYIFDLLIEAEDDNSDLLDWVD